MTFRNSTVGISTDLLKADGKAFLESKLIDRLRSMGVEFSEVKSIAGEIDPEAVAYCDAILVGAPKINRNTLKNDCGRLRIVARNGVGYDALDLDALTEHGIIVTNTPTAVRYPVACAALSFLLALSLKLPLRTKMIREGRFAERSSLLGVGLRNRTLGLVGLGGIGQELVRLAEPLGMRIVAADPFVDPAIAEHLGVEIRELDVILKESDFIIVTCRLDSNTFHLINARCFSLMKNSSYIINVARGAIIDEEALISALESGQIAGAGLDVFETEPVLQNHRLLTMDNVIPTPHSLCWTDSFVEDVGTSAIESVIDALEGRIPRHVVNPAVTEKSRVLSWTAKN